MSSKNKIKILHMVTDDKFIDFIYEIFSENPFVENKFVLWTPDLSAALKYVKSAKIWRRVGRDYVNSESACFDLGWCDCLILHSMKGDFARLIQRVSLGVVVVWSGWGWDYYDHLDADLCALFEPETIRLLISHGLLPDKKINSENEKKFIQNILFPSFYRVDLFSAPIFDDYKKLCCVLGGGFKAKFSQIIYGSIEDSFVCEKSNSTGINILVGNSATPTNNHIEIFEILSKINLDGKKVVVPLSYGEDKYRTLICEKGKEILGDKFFPLTEFFPLKQYNRILACCSVAIMNHVRQQALGNIGFMLYWGKRVFLNPRGENYKFFHQMGFSVNQTNELGHIKAIDEPIGKSELTINRDLLEKIGSRKTARQHVENLVENIIRMKPIG